jgi:predicted ATPase
LAFHPKVTFFVGRNFNFATRASHSDLDGCLRVARTVSLARDSYFLRAESFYNVATEIERLGLDLLAAYGDRSLHEQSHGESFFAVFWHRFRGNGLYLMDEPEAALSPKRQLEFLSILHDHCQQGAQFVIATHSPIIMAYPDARIYVFGEEGIREVPFQEMEHYLVTRGFLANPQRTLSRLLSDDAPAEPGAPADGGDT